MESTLLASFKGLEHRIVIRELEQASLADVLRKLSSALAIEEESIKVILPGGKLLKASNTTARQTAIQAGLRAGMKVLVVGSASSEVAAVRNSRDLPGMAGFDHELRTLASRRQRGSAVSAALPTGPYTFGSFEAWGRPGLRPAPSEATKLLHRLAADPGIVSVMREHRWGVGKLSEMPPEGKVGVSAVCILGVNINAGQEISLRLRTDDLKGFRRYQSIRDTLCHELAHMVWSEHDNRFKTLNSQIRNHVDRVSGSAGRRAFESAEGWSLDVPSGPQDAMAASKASSGMTVRQLAGGSLPQPSSLPQRLEEVTLDNSCGMVKIGRTRCNADKGAVDTIGLSFSHRQGFADRGGLAPDKSHCHAFKIDKLQGDGNLVPEVEAMGHRDAATEAKEEAMERLTDPLERQGASPAAPQTAPEQDAAHRSFEGQSKSSLAGESRPSGSNEPEEQRTPLENPAEPNLSGAPDDTVMQDASIPETSQSEFPDSQGAVPAPSRLPEPLVGLAAAGSSDRAQLTAEGSHMAEEIVVNSQGLAKEANRGAEGRDAQEGRVQEVSGESQDDITEEYLARATRSLDAILKAGNLHAASTAIATLSTILKNALQNPGDPKFQRIKLRNSAFQSRVAQLPGALDLLKSAGFVPLQEGEEQVLKLVRDDPGLLWITLSACETALQEINVA